MNFLELCQSVVREGAITPGDDKPSTVVGQKGRMKLVVDWVNRANREIQAARNDFSFRVRAVDFLVEPDDEVIRMIETHPDIESINEMTASVRDSSGAQPISPVAWQQYRYQRLSALQTTTGLPTQFSVDTVGDIHLIPKPVSDVIFRAEVKLSPQTMTADDDVSYIPTQYHDAIVYKALTYFYKYDESEGQLREAERDYMPIFNNLVAATTVLNDWNNTQTGETLMVMSCD